MSVRGKIYVPMLFLCAVLVIGGGAVFASGQSEKQLTTAEQLIREKRYNDAILVLTAVMKQSPREFDRAQALLREIDKARSAYNAKVAELIRLFNEGNLEQAYVVIKELEALDKNPDKQMIAAQAYAKEVAAVVYNTEQFQALMNRALPQLASGDFAAAMTTYLSGLTIGQELFDEGNFGNIAVDKVNALRSGIESSGKEFITLWGQLRSEQARLEADTGSLDKLRIDLSGYLSTLNRIAELRQRMVSDSTALLGERKSLLVQRPSQTDVQLVSFIDRIVYGRTGNTVPEGMLVAIGTPWDQSLTKVSSTIFEVARADFTTAQAAFDAGRWVDAGNSYGSALAYALEAERAAAAWGMRISVGPGLMMAQEDWTLMRRELPGYLDTASLAQAAESYIALTRAAQSAEEISGTMVSPTATVAELSSEGDRVGKLLDAIESVRSQWDTIKGSLTALAQNRIDTTASLRRADSVLAAVATLESGAADSQVRIVAREAALQYAPVTAALADVQQNVRHAHELVSGVPQSSTGAQQAVVISRKYPDQARRLLTDAQTKLGELDATVSSVEAMLAGETEPVRRSQTIRSTVATGERLRGEIGTLRSSVASALSQAEKDIFQAARFKQEGDNRLQQAEAAIGRGEFATARQLIAEAASSFDQSLSFAEDPAVRQLRDVQIPQLSQRVANSENEIVVGQVRTYINQGRAYYSQGQYTQAQDVFLRAQSLWRTTNNQDDPEISSWLSYVDTALSINSGRTVAPTDPLYPEVTQVLNLAESDFEKGKQLLAQGDRNSAQRYFNDAQQKLLYVQIPFPLNQKARVLSLEILELTDPVNFRATFQQKFDQAVAELQRNPQVAYVSLEDLKAIDQNFPGLAGALDRAEILTGIKRPPPDPAKIAQSDQLYQKAFDIVRTNVRAQYPIAISYLNQAIELDPNNQQAAALKDRIAIAAGAGTTVVLSNRAQIEFKQAQEQFIAKSYYEALRIVNQLLADPSNKDYYPLIELKRRIESKI